MVLDRLLFHKSFKLEGCPLSTNIKDPNCLQLTKEVTGNSNVIGFIHLLLEKNDNFRSDETRPALSTKYSFYFAKWTPDSMTNKFY